MDKARGKCNETFCKQISKYFVSIYIKVRNKMGRSENTPLINYEGFLL